MAVIFGLHTGWSLATSVATGDHALGEAPARAAAPHQEAQRSKEAARRGPDGKPLEEMARTTIEGTAVAPEPTVPLPPKSQTDAS